MTAKYVYTDDMTGEKIEPHTSYFEVQLTTLNINSYEVTEPPKHFVHRRDALSYLKDLDYQQATIRRKVM